MKAPQGLHGRAKPSKIAAESVLHTALKKHKHLLREIYPTAPRARTKVLRYKMAWHSLLLAHFIFPEYAPCQTFVNALLNYILWKEGVLVSTAPQFKHKEPKRQRVEDLAHRPLFSGTICSKWIGTRTNGSPFRIIHICQNATYYLTMLLRVFASRLAFIIVTLLLIIRIVVLLLPLLSLLSQGLAHFFILLII